MTRAACEVFLMFALVAVAAGGVRMQAERGAGQTTWRLDNLERIAGHPVRVVGAPRLVSSDLGPVVEFNGRTDGLFVDVNPLAGLERFTIEVVFQPAADGPAEQRFVHVEERGTGNRALIELRMAPGGRWALDTYLRTGDTGLTLLDRGRSHAAAEWHVAALTYDGTTMAHYVNGVRELAGAIRFPPIGEGTLSLGVRQNLVSWFKGRIHSVRVSPAALPPERLLTAPQTMARDVIELWPEGVPGRQPGGGDERMPFVHAGGTAPLPARAARLR